MKKILIGLLAALLVFGTLFGCRNPAQESALQPTPEPTAEPVDPLSEVDAAEITESKHAREEGYKNPFRTRLIDTPLAAVHLEAGDSCSDEAVRALAKTVVSDISAIAAFTGETPRKVTVYVIGRMQRDRALLLGDHLICTVDDVESGAYREALIGACYDLPIPWIQIGLVENIFGTPDESSLKDFYADEAHVLTASCAAVYFLSDVADEATIAAARETAASIVSFAIKTEGFDTLKAIKSTSEVLPAWSGKIGLDAAPALPEGNEQAAVMKAYKDKTPSRVCILQFDNLTVNVKKGGFAQTPDELYAFSCRYFYGADIVLRQIAEEASYLSEIAEEHYRAPYVINLNDDPTSNGISTSWCGEIDLKRESAVWHELVHWLLWKPREESFTVWQQEAVAEYFSNRALSLAMPQPYDEALFFYSEEMTEEERLFQTHWLDIYLAERGRDMGVPSDLMSAGTQRRAYAICTLLLGTDPGGDTPCATLAGARGKTADEKETDPNALSYFEAPVFLEYLFDHYGEEAVLTGYWNNVPLKDTCGKDYRELYQDFLAYLRETYGQYISDSDID